MNDKPNPERRSDSALLCLGIGAGLVALSYFLGVGGVLTAAMTGGSPLGVAGGVAGAIAAVLGGVTGGVLILIGAVWIFIRVIADSREADKDERYKDVER